VFVRSALALGQSNDNFAILRAWLPVLGWSPVPAQLPFSWGSNHHFHDGLLGRKGDGLARLRIERGAGRVAERVLSDKGSDLAAGAEQTKRSIRSIDAVVL
jgi:hypothetical protein